MRGFARLDSREARACEFWWWCGQIFRFCKREATAKRCTHAKLSMGKLERCSWRQPYHPICVKMAHSNATLALLLAAASRATLSPAAHAPHHNCASPHTTRSRRDGRLKSHRNSLFTRGVSSLCVTRSKPRCSRRSRATPRSPSPPHSSSWAASSPASPRAARPSTSPPSRRRPRHQSRHSRQTTRPRSTRRPPRTRRRSASTRRRRSRSRPT